MTQTMVLPEPERAVRLLESLGPAEAINLFSSREMAYFLFIKVFPKLGRTFRTRQLFTYMEQAYKLTMMTTPTVSMGKPGRRARWRQIVSDALTLLLEEGYLRMIATRHYEIV